MALEASRHEGDGRVNATHDVADPNLAAWMRARETVFGKKRGLMTIELVDLKPNPLRDFDVDPIDPEAVARLQASIKEDGFWGGVVCRQSNGHIEIAAGHHRVAAAIGAGIQKADLFVAEDMDDTALARIYARENSTQRGTANGTARAGSVAAALRLAAYEILTGTFCGIPQKVEGVSKGSADGNIASARGIGQDVILAYLAGIPGITINTVKEDLASLKKSGDYARIIAAVRDRIVREQGPETEAAVRAEQAAAKAAETEPTFDFKGVAAHLKNSLQIESFRNTVTSEGVRSYLPVNQQADVARRLVELAIEQNHELTGLFIRENLVRVVMGIKQQERALSAEEQARMFRLNWEAQYRDLQDHFAGALRQLQSYGGRLSDHLKKKPKDATLSIPPRMRESVSIAKSIIIDLEEGL